MALNAGDKGEWAKLVVEAALLGAGAEVYRAVSPAASVQLLIVWPLSAPIRHSRIAVRTALVKPTKDDPDRLAFVGQAPPECDVLAFATPEARALFASPYRMDGPTRKVGGSMWRWWDDSGLDLARLDGPTIIVAAPGREPGL